MKTELLSQSEKMLQIKQHIDSVEIMLNDMHCVSIFANPVEIVTDKAIMISKPFSDKKLWIPKSIIILMDRIPNKREGLTYQIVLPEWFLQQNRIEK